MRSARVVFEWSGLAIDIFPATADNAAFAEELEKQSRPHQLALSLDRMTERLARQILATTYAKTVIIGSPDKGFATFGVVEWTDWLLKHDDEFDMLQEIAQNPGDWEKFASGS